MIFKYFVEHLPAISSLIKQHGMPECIIQKLPISTGAGRGAGAGLGGGYGDGLGAGNLYGLYIVKTPKLLNQRDKTGNDSETVLKAPC